MTQAVLKNREGLVDDLSKCWVQKTAAVHGNKRAALPWIGSLEMRRAIA
jgi:hypothetical protein